MKNPIAHLRLSQQLAAITLFLCLLISLALVALAATSSAHVQQAQQQAFGNALAHQIARRISTALETGDLLSAAASLQRFVETSSAEEVAIYDVEGKALGRAGRATGTRLAQHRADVRIDDNVAGEVIITVSTDGADAAHLRFVLSLLGLAVLLSVAAYAISRHFGQAVADRLLTMARAIALDPSQTEPRSQQPPNELELLAHNVEALPMELLRARGGDHPREDNYRAATVLFVQLNSLADYVDTLDEHSLHRYTDRLRQVIYTAAGFYDGQLQVARQFGLVIYFNGEHSSGSPSFRAACCSWLIQTLCERLENQMTLSMGVSMAIGQSELGMGDEADIYSGLYLQHTIDELAALCARKPPKVLLAPAVYQDADVAGRLDFEATELDAYQMLTGVEPPYAELLDRQLRLVWKRLSRNPAR